VVKAGIGAKTAGTSLGETTCETGSGYGFVGRRHAGMKAKVLPPVLRAEGGTMLDDLISQIERLTGIGSGRWRS
jgi:hypothetical protein